MDQPTPKITILLLAAGASSRMGKADKLLEKIDGIPLLQRVQTACLASKADAVVSILGANAAAQRPLLDPQIQVVENQNWACGMASSLRVALAATPKDSDAIMVVLADMPDVTSADINALIGAFSPRQGPSICRAVTHDGNPGHPVLFSRKHFVELAQLTGDRGANPVLSAHADAIMLVPTPNQNALTDLDTPADWAAYKSRP